MSSKRAIGDVRPSQVITTFGPGAVVDLQTLSVIVSGIDGWHPQEELVIREHRLERALRVKRFFQAEPASGGFGFKKGTVPASVFPRYQVCSNPDCATLSEYRGLKYGYPSSEDRTEKLKKEYGGDSDYSHLCRFNEFTQEMECKAPNCKGRGKFRAPTIPAPFVVACPSGHIDDFPWRAYVHRDADTNCKKRMRLVYSGTTGSVSDIWIYCACDAKRSVSDAFGENRSLALGECTRKRPWLGIKNKDPHECKHAGQLRAIQRGATNGWFPLVRSALSIKEAASPIGQALKKCPQHQVEKIDSQEKLQTLLDLEMFPTLAEFKAEEIWQTLLKERGEIETDEIDLRLPEWNAFRDIEGSNQGDQSDFFLEAGEVPDFLADKVDRIVLARKLLEVRALTSFTRIDYASGMDDDGMGASRAPIYKERQDWLPAVEVRGEGIFLELKEEALTAWEAEPAVQKRAAAIEQKYKEWAAERGVDADDFPGARYVLLHSLAHVLMRQLALDCGYSESSVRERIYSSTDPERKMAGILLYTASADSEGSLGGLVDLGTKERLPNLIHNALENAKRCSSDPLCADHQPDVHATINGAACHACVLAPETSCEAFNRFLDRNFLVPTMAYSDMAYFK
ncbi:DrmB family protein [Vibrio fluvialis]